MHDRGKDWDLPSFRRVKRRYAASLIHSVLSGPTGSALRNLVEYDDGHFRAIFATTYFQLAEGQSAPSKSQWNTLKKKLKRRNRLVFIFREQGAINCSSAAVTGPTETCFYLDFGFLNE